MAISLIEAIRSGDVTLAKKLLAQRKFTCLNSQTARNDGTALYWACCLGYLELARSLLEQGANPNTLTAWRGSPLHAACDNDQFDVAQWVLFHACLFETKYDKIFFLWFINFIEIIVCIY